MAFNKKLTVGLVGPCAAGKTTMTNLLQERGIKVRHIAQEHSYVKTMWEKIAHPDILIYLDVSYTTSLKRRPLNWSNNEFNIQVDRLSHARTHADHYIYTDDLSIEEVFENILNYLEFDILS